MQALQSTIDKLLKLDKESLSKINFLERNEYALTVFFTEQLGNELQKRNLIKASQKSQSTQRQKQAENKGFVVSRPAQVSNLMYINFEDNTVDGISIDTPFEYENLNAIKNTIEEQGKHSSKSLQEKIELASFIFDLNKTILVTINKLKSRISSDDDKVIPSTEELKEGETRNIPGESEPVFFEKMTIKHEDIEKLTTVSAWSNSRNQELLEHRTYKNEGVTINNNVKQLQPALACLSPSSPELIEILDGSRRRMKCIQSGEDFVILLARRTFKRSQIKALKAILNENKPLTEYEKALELYSDYQEAIIEHSKANPDSNDILTRADFAKSINQAVESTRIKINLASEINPSVIIAFENINGEDIGLRKLIDFHYNVFLKVLSECIEESNAAQDEGITSKEALRRTKNTALKDKLINDANMRIVNEINHWGERYISTDQDKLPESPITNFTRYYKKENSTVTTPAPKKHRSETSEAKSKITKSKNGSYNLTITNIDIEYLTSKEFIDFVKNNTHKIA